jgi:hypothetical protein
MVGSVLGANDVNLTGLALTALAGLAILLHGFAIVRDWHGWGTRSYERTIRLPFTGFYREEGGFESYRLLVGWGGVVGGCLFLVVVVVGLFHLEVAPIRRSGLGQGMVFGGMRSIKRASSSRKSRRPS